MFLWPCHLPAWETWCALQTQWRTSMAGATGLDYAAALAWLRDVEGLAGDELRERMQLLRACEHAVLEVYARRDDEAPMG